MSTRSKLTARSRLSGPFSSFAAASGISSRLEAPPRAARIPLEKARERADRSARRLATDPRIRLVYLFGSTAACDCGTVGDIDLGVIARPALSFRELVDLRAAIATDAGPGLDLVSLDDASVVLAWEVVQHGECLYAGDPAEQLDFETRARSSYWDFKPFLDTQWELAGRRLEERLRHGSQA